MPVPLFATLHSLRNFSGTNTLAYLVGAVSQAGRWAGRQIDSQAGRHRFTNMWIDRWIDVKMDRRT
jgi:hypothetical protein